VRFYLGVHHPNWLAELDVPMCVSHRWLVGRKTLPRARGPWMLDSGAFTQLSHYEGWATYHDWSLHPSDAAKYVRAIRRYADEIGNLDWAAPQDWMCEPGIRRVTGRSVRQHQWLTCQNLLMIRSLLARTCSRVRVVPVLTGDTVDDYLRHYDMWTTEFRQDLEEEPLVGLGSVCRLQSTAKIGLVVKKLSHLPLHGFGVKTLGLARYGDRLVSADSMAWSVDGRRTTPGCTPSHKSEANCRRFALEWRERLLATVASAKPDLQDPLF
jgi:hypothetical protein